MLLEVARSMHARQTDVVDDSMPRLPFFGYAKSTANGPGLCVIHAPKTW